MIKQENESLALDQTRTFYIKKFKTKYPLARTLHIEDVYDGDDYDIEITYSIRTHDDGWTIEGDTIFDLRVAWVEDFRAHHPKYGQVFGNFENKVYADSREGYNHFVKHHPYEEWHSIYDLI